MAAVAIQISTSPQYLRFPSAIENPNTRVLYEGVLKMFVEFTGAKTGGDLLDGDNIVIEDRIIQWVTTMKKSGIQVSTIKARTEVLKLFFEMNRKPLAWKIIARTIGKARSLKHRGWRREEISKMLSVAKIREQAVILLLCSSGCRRGALEWQDNKGTSHYLQMKHLAFSENTKKELTFRTVPHPQSIETLVRTLELVLTETALRGEGGMRASNLP